MRKLISGMISCVAIVLAQDGHSVLPATLGYVTASNGTELRPVLGIPGAAHAGGPLSIPGVKRWFIPPGSGYVLALTADGLQYAIDPRSLATEPITATAPEADVVAFSPGGRAAAVYVKSSGTVQVIAGLPHAPAVAHTWTVSSEAKALAISEDGRTVLAEDASGLITNVPDGKTVRKSSHFSPQFAAEGADVFVSDAAAGRAWRDSNALGASADAAFLFSGGGDSRKLTVLNRNTGTTEEYRTALPIAELRAMSVPDTFLITYTDGSYGLFLWRDGKASFAVVGVAREEAGQ